MEDIFFPAAYDCMPGIISTLAPNNYINFTSKDIDDLSLAFISPLGTHKNCIWHDFLREKSRTESPAKWAKIAISLTKCKDKGVK